MSHQITADDLLRSLISDPLVVPRYNSEGPDIHYRPWGEFEIC